MAEPTVACEVIMLAVVHCCCEAWAEAWRVCASACEARWVLKRVGAGAGVAWKVWRLLVMVDGISTTVNTRETVWFCCWSAACVGFAIVNLTRLNGLATDWEVCIRLRGVFCWYCCCWFGARTEACADELSALQLPVLLLSLAWVWAWDRESLTGAEAWNCSCCCCWNGANAWVGITWTE